MEMIGPKTYIEKFKNKSIEELLNEKNFLLEEIDRFEKLSRNPEEIAFLFDDINIQLDYTKKYLKEIEELIKLRGEIINSNTFKEVEAKMNNFNFGEKYNICIHKSPVFYLELVKGNFNDLTKIIIDDKLIKVILYNGSEIIKEDKIENQELINKIKIIIEKNKKKIIDIGLKLNMDYIIKHGKENSFSDSMLLKFDNFIINISNGSIGNRKAQKLFKLIYDEII